MMEHYHAIKPLECTVVGPGVVVKVEEEEVYSPQNNENPVTNTAENPSCLLSVEGGDSIKHEVDVKAEQSEETCNRRKRKSDRRKRIPENNIVTPKPEIPIKTEDDREDSYMRNPEDRSLKTRTGHNLKTEIEVKLEADDQSYAMGDQNLEERDSSPAASPDYFLVQIKEEEEDMSFGMDYQQHGERVSHPQTSSGYGEAVREKDGRIHRMSSKMFIDIAQLIQLVQERPELYNPKTPSYADRYKKKKAWDEICAIVVPDWELCSEKEKNIKVKTVKTRWRSMKDNYAKELRLQRRERRSGSGVGKRRVYAYFSLLEFLRPVIKLRQAESNMDDLEDQVEESSGCMDDSRSTGSPLIIEEVASTSPQVTEATEANSPSASSVTTARILATPPTRARDNSPSASAPTTRRILATPPTRAKDNAPAGSTATAREILVTSPPGAHDNSPLACTATTGRNRATPPTRAQDTTPSASTTTRRNRTTPPTRAQTARQSVRAEAPRRWAQQPTPIMEDVIHFFIEEARKQRGRHYNLAMSFIPYLEDIPMERLAAATIDILNVMTAYKEEVPPRPYVSVPQHDMDLPYYPQRQQPGYQGYPHPQQAGGYPGYPQQPEYHSSPQPPQQPGYHGYPPTPPPP